MHNLFFAVVALLYIPTLAVGQLPGLGSVAGAGVKVGGEVVGAVAGVTCELARTAVKVAINPIMTLSLNTLESGYKNVLAILDKLCVPIFKFRDDFLTGKYDKSVSGLLSILNPILAALPKLSNKSVGYIDQNIALVNSVWAMHKKVSVNIKLPCNRKKVNGKCLSDLNTLQCLAASFINNMPASLEKAIGLLNNFKNAIIVLANFAKKFNKVRPTLQYVKDVIATIFKLHDIIHVFFNESIAVIKSVSVVVKKILSSL